MPCVLFVDDEPKVLSAYERCLKDEPYRVVTTTSAADALLVLAREPIDVVVSDESMPGMTGTEFLGLVRRRFPDVVRIMLTAVADLTVTRRAIEEGVLYRLLAKPAVMAELSSTLRNALHMKTLARAR